MKEFRKWKKKEGTTLSIELTQSALLHGARRQLPTYVWRGGATSRRIGLLRPHDVL
jgi:hypothetical protein